MNNILITSYTLPCGTVLNNRIAKAALTERIAQADHLPHEGHIQLYKHWAKHGAGLLISGNILVDRRYLESTGNVVIEQHTDLEPFQVWTKEVCSYGNHFWAQLGHAGRQSSKFSTRRPVSASDVQLKKMGLFARPMPLTESGILDIVDRFVHAAGFCKEAGFTGIQIHAAHGYLISQFLSPNINNRTDQWGGAIDNRARLLLTMVDKIRAKVGPDYPIGVKLNSADFQRGGFDEADARYVIKQLEERGVDLLEISGGTYEQTTMFGMGLKDSTKQREAYFLDFARELRAESSIPLMVTGGFRSRAFCEEALERNELDIIGFGRPFLLDESFPEGFLIGTMDRIDDPHIPIVDANNKDAAIAGFYDLQIKRLAAGQDLKFDYSGFKLATHIGQLEMKMGLRNWWYRRRNA
jgi:2,4-dienoyl-CoA reductase-like NADH-dependent reductase (Old Yellow Enzyme family)